MTNNNKFKLGDRVEYTHKKTNQIIQGEIVDISGDDLDQTIVVNWIQHYNSYLSPNELTLIDLDPEEPSNLSDDTVKGFNPENLEFDGREIKEGDKILINSLRSAHTVLQGDDDDLAIDVGYNAGVALYINIKALNITSHRPAKSELEKAAEEKKLLIDKISNGDFYPGKTKNILDKYAELKERYNQLTNK